MSELAAGIEPGQEWAHLAGGYSLVSGRSWEDGG